MVIANSHIVFDFKMTLKRKITIPMNVLWGITLQYRAFILKVQNVMLIDLFPMVEFREVFFLRIIGSQMPI